MRLSIVALTACSLWSLSIISVGHYSFYADLQAQESTDVDQIDRGQQTFSISDRELGVRIKNVLKNSYNNPYEDVTVEVNNGVITLTGSVRQASDKQAAVQKIENVVGTSRIEEKLMVKPARRKR